VDWDGDGMLDIIVGERYGLVHYYHRTANDAITLTKGPDVTCGGVTINVSYNSAPCIVDWNEDGHQDMLLGNQDGYVRLYLNDGGDSVPAFSSFSYIQSGGTNIVNYRNCPQVYDLNGDGKKDLLCGANDSHVWYYENVGTNEAPVFNGKESLIYKYSGMRFWMADWNGDNLVDVLSSDYNGWVWVWIQESTGVGGSGAGIPARTLCSSENPFRESVTIQGEGFRDATLSIYDISGHAVASGPFHDSYTWGGGAATGAYFVQVSDDQGTGTLRLVKL
jgi:hypothetical protein